MIDGVLMSEGFGGFVVPSGCSVVVVVVFVCSVRVNNIRNIGSSYQRLV